MPSTEPRARCAIKPERQIDWERLKTIALSLGLPGVEETYLPGPADTESAWQALGMSPHEDAPIFKVPFEECEILVEAEPSTFFVTTHYKATHRFPVVLGCAARQSRRHGEIGYHEKSMG